MLVASQIRAGTALRLSGEIWKVLAAEVSALGPMSFASLPETGLLLDATPWAALPFIEGETLHFKPAAQPAAVTA